MKATLKGIKEKNIGLIINEIRKNPNSSRTMISKSTKLAKSATSDLVKILIEYNIIYEDEKIESNLGKKPTRLKFNENYKLILALNIERDNVNIALTNLDGEIIYRIDNKNFSADSRKEILQFLTSSIDKILKNSKNLLEKILVISIGTHGVVNPKNNIVTHAPYLKEWSNINLIDIFHKKYKKDTILNNSINLGALGEQWKNFNNKKDIIYINIDHGVGAGLIIDNKLVRGNTGTTGEISYLPIILDNNYNELRENKLELGFYEKQIDVTGITKTVINNLESSYGMINKYTDFKKICSLYKNPRNNPIKDLINDKIVKKIALGISSMLVTIDTELVIINGEILNLGDEFFKKLKDEVSRIIPFEKNIVASQLKEDAHILGAIREGMNYVNNILYNKFYSLVK